MSSELPLDREWLTSLCSAGTSFLRDLLWLFKDQSHNYIRTLRSTTLQKNEELCALTHKLKGSASSLGLKRLAALTQEFENHIRAGVESESDLRRRAELLESEINTGATAVAHYIEEIDKHK